MKHYCNLSISRNVAAACCLALIALTLLCGEAFAETSKKSQGALAHQVHALAFDSDGQQLASGRGDGSIELWDPVKGLKVHTWSAHQGAVTSVAFSPDGKWLASGSKDHDVLLWNTGSENLIATLKGHKSIISAVAFSPDGRMIASASWDRTIMLWEAATGKRIRTLTGHMAAVLSLAFSADGKKIVSGGEDGLVKLWNPQTGQELATFKGHKGAVGAVCFFSGGARVVSSSGWDETIRYWEIAREDEVANFTSSEIIGPLAITPDGSRLLSGAAEGILIFDAKSGSRLRKLEIHSGIVKAISLTFDGRLFASGGEDGVIRLWDLVEHRQIHALGSSLTSPGVTSRPKRTVPLEGTGGLAAEVAHRPPTLVRQSGSQFSDALAVSPDGRLLAFTHSALFGNVAALTIIEAASMRELRTIVTQGGVKNIAFMTNDTLVTAGEDGKLSAWNARTGGALWNIKGRDEPIEALAVTRDGQRIATARSFGGATEVFDNESGAMMFGIPALSFVKKLAWLPDGRRLALTDAGGLVSVWDVVERRQEALFSAHPDRIAGLAISEDGRHLATIDDSGFVRVWATEGYRLVSEFMSKAKSISKSLSFSPVEFHLAVGDSEGIWIHDARNGSPIRDLPGRSPLLFAEDGRMLYAQGGPGTGIVGYGVADGVKNSSAVFAEGGALEIADPTSNILVVGKVVAPGRQRLLTWSGSKGQPIGRTEFAFNRVTTFFLVSPDSKHMIAGSDRGEVIVQDIFNTVQPRHFTLANHRVAVAAVFVDDMNLALVTVNADDLKNRLSLLDSEMTEDEIIANEKKSMDKSTYRIDRFSIESGTLQAGSEHPGLASHLQFLRSTGTLIVAGPEQPPIRMTLQGKPLRQPGIDTPPGRCCESIHAGENSAVIAALGDDASHIWDTASGKLMHTQVRRENEAFMQNVRVAPGGEMVAIGHTDGRIKLNQVSGVSRMLDGHAGAVFGTSGLGFLQGGKILASSGDKEVTLWNVADGRPLASLYSFTDGTWVVATREGRFDTNDLEEIRGLQWVMSDDPLRAQPLELFMRDYYEPGLLTRLLAGEQFPPIRHLSELNRIQPEVRILAVEPDPAAVGRVKVSVEVRNVRGRIGDRSIDSGASDLIVFRNRQRVAGHVGDLSIQPGESRRFEFPGIRLPSGSHAAIDFSAYAFNADHVKSVTAHHTHRVSPQAPSEGMRRTYLVNIGVDAYTGAFSSLQYAVADARAMQGALIETFARRADQGSSEVVPVLLLASQDKPDGNAGREDIRAVLDLLAGKPVAAAQRSRITNVEQIRPATPDDTLIISFAGHGLNGDNGIFHLIPAGVKGEHLNATVLAQSISTDDLAVWLQDVDAGQIVMILDACHSGAAVASEGFKPGPMGSRGLGQLAYNKMIRILAASQADDVAMESDHIRHGLLTYALVREGLDKGLADFSARDGKIVLGEWLRWGIERVPTLFAEVKEGRLASSRGATRILPLGFQTRPARVQQPALFDFYRPEHDMVLR